MSKHYIIGWMMIVWATAFLPAAHAVGLEIAVGAWRQDPSGDASYKASGPGDILSVEDDLRYDRENRFSGRAKVDMPLFLPNIYLMAAPSEFDGNGAKDVDFTFGDTTFSGAIPFYSKLDFDQYDVGFYYGIPLLQTATLNRLNIDVGINVRILDLEALVRQSGIEEKEDITLVVPQVYLGAQFAPIDWLAFEAEGRGLSIGGNNMYSLIGRVRVKVAGPLFAAAGYRYDKIDVDEDDVDVDFTIQGPFAEVGLKF